MWLADQSSKSDAVVDMASSQTFSGTLRNPPERVAMHRCDLTDSSVGFRNQWPLLLTLQLQRSSRG